MTDDVLFSRRPRDLAMTDLRFALRAQGVLTDRRGYRYLVYASAADPWRRGAPVLDGDAREPRRRLADCAVGMLCGGFYLAAIWYTFFVM